MSEKFWLNTDDFFFYEIKDGQWARHHQATLDELKFLTAELEIRGLKARLTSLGDTAKDPKSPVGALSGLMARLRARSGLRKR